METQDLAIDGQTIFDTLVNDRQNSPDSWTIVRLLGFVALNLLGDGRLVRQMHARINSFP
jgi:hypothetical protein